MGREARNEELHNIEVELARERAEAARLRSEIVAVTLSLEAGKNKLEHLLLESEAQRSSTRMTAGPADDTALMRSMELQIQATREGLASLSAKETTLVAEIAQLSSLLVASHSSTSRLDSANGQSAEINAAVARRAVESLREAALAADSSANEPPGVLGRDANVRWREHCLPNLSMLRSGSSPDGDSVLGSGVLVDRVFDGIVSFSPGYSRMVSSAGRTLMADPGLWKEDLEVSSCTGPVSHPVPRGILVAAVSEHSSLSIADISGSLRINVVAVSASIQCMKQLIDVHSLKLPGSSQLAAHVGKVSDAESSDGPREGPKDSMLSPLAKNDNDMSTAMGIVPAPVEPPPKLSHGSKVLGVKQFSQLLNAVPKRFQDSDLQRLYCSDADGIALSTLLKKAAHASPSFLVLRDTGNHVFGCYASVPWKDSSSRSYGTGECWVFRASPAGDMEVFKWSRKNSFFQVSSHEHVAIGGGGHFALWIDEDLLYGSTALCPTFDNPPLTPGSREPSARNGGPAIDSQNGFQIVVVELWKLSPPGHLVS